MSCLKLLTDDKTTEILYGGSAGSGKSFLGCAWIIMSALKYPGTRWVIARSRLGILKITTINTFKDIIKDWGLTNYVDYHLFNNNITFKNGSEIILLDLFLYPQDPDYVKLGSLEITGALIDEAAEIDKRAYTILTTRFRYKLNEYNLIPKLLIVSNPTTNWLYDFFYKLSVDGKLPPYRKFVRALSTDNLYLNKDYIENLKRLPDIDRRRLFLGEWEFSDDEYMIFNVNALYDAFHKKSSNISKKKYITCDVASTGNDRTCITYWEGLTCMKIDTYKHLDTLQIVVKLKELMASTSTPVSSVIVDATGVGVGVVDTLKGCKPFIAASKALKDENFLNLKSQCYFKFAELINNNEVSFQVPDDMIEPIVDELIKHKRYKADTDGKYRVTPKEIVKRELGGNSPDLADALMFRFYFEYRNEFSFSFIT